MVSAVLRFVETDGTILPPIEVEIVAPCPFHRSDCIEVHNSRGEPLFVSASELAAE